MMSERSERRASSRYRLALPVTIGDAHGATRDISTSGVFFMLHERSAGSLTVNQSIRFRLTLEHADPHGPMHIGCEGHVVRVEVGAEAVGVAVSVDAYDLSGDQVTWPSGEVMP
jgi:hypothetical protein